MCPEESPTAPETRHPILDRSRVTAGLSTIALGAAAAALWTVELSLGQPAAPAPVTGALAWCTAGLGMVWLVCSAERRLLRRIREVEATKYRDGYVDGYMDAAGRRAAPIEVPLERPSLRPVR